MPLRTSPHFFFFTNTAPSEIYTLSLHDALPICGVVELASLVELVLEKPNLGLVGVQAVFVGGAHKQEYTKSIDRKSTRLNSSHEWISYAVFCLKKKKKQTKHKTKTQRNTAKPNS